MIEIDEAIARIEETKPFIVGQSKVTNAIQTLVDFAKWYREQDLVKREDVFKSCSCSLHYSGSRGNCSEAYICEICQYYDAAYVDLFKIPNAELRR